MEGEDPLKTGMNEGGSESVGAERRIPKVAAPTLWSWWVWEVGTAFHRPYISPKEVLVPFWPLKRCHPVKAVDKHSRHSFLCINIYTQISTSEKFGIISLNLKIK